MSEGKVFSKADNEFGFGLFDLSELKSNPVLDLVSKAVKLDTHLLFLVTAGGGQVTLDSIDYEIAENSILIAPMSRVIQLTDADNLQAYVFSFSQEYLMLLLQGQGIVAFSKVFYKYQFSPVIDLDPEGVKQIIKRSEEIAAEMRSGYQQYGHKRIVELHLRLFMNELIRAFLPLNEQEDIPRSVKIFFEFEGLVEQRFKHTRSAQDYARMLNISYKTLNQICKANITKTAKAYIDIRVIDELKHELVQSNKSVQKIAYEFGFEDPANMGKYFKSRVGQTPNQFRNELIK